MKTLWKITKSDSKFAEKIYKIFQFKDDEFAHFMFVVQCWLDTDNNEIHLVKKNNKWTYLLISTDTCLDTKSDTVVLNVKNLLTSLN
mgnify:CR=1 FL=1